jgi:transposase, IS5 family
VSLSQENLVKRSIVRKQFIVTGIGIMARINSNKISLVDAMVSEHTALKVLDEVLEVIDWERIEGMLSCICANKKDEQSWSPLLMFKAMLLQTWYNLSELKLEQQLVRDLLFRRFVGLGPDDSVPDYRSLWRFRNYPSMERLHDGLLKDINDQLAEKGLFVTMGAISIVDASVHWSAIVRMQSGAPLRANLK